MCFQKIFKNIISITGFVKELPFQICLHNQMSHFICLLHSYFQTFKGVSERSLPQQMEYSSDCIAIATTAAPDNQCSVDFHATCEVTGACRIFFIPIGVLIDLIRFNIWFDLDPRKRTKAEKNKNVRLVLRIVGCTFGRLKMNINVSVEKLTMN